MHKIADIDKRRTPRFKTDSIHVSGGLKGRVVDIHDGGLSIKSSDILNLQDKFILNLQLPSQVCSASAVLKWKYAENGHFVYGAEFNEMNPKMAMGLWRFLISERYRKICKSVSGRPARMQILRFAKKLTKYISGIVAIQTELEKSSGTANTQKLLKELTSLNDGIVRAGESLKEVIDSKIALDRIKSEFRDIVGCWTFKSQIMKRGFDKPKGYPGDYETLEVIYDRKSFGNVGDLGHLFDLYFLNNPYADAVRQRMKDMQDKVDSIIDENKTGGKVKILDLASGSAREFYEIFKNRNRVFEGQYHVTLLDWDNDALEFTKNRNNSCLPKSFKFDYLKEDLLNFIKSEAFFAKNGEHDFIYSIGLADYLPDRVLKKMINVCAKGLKAGGQFVLAHKDKEVSFSHLPPEWFCDWVFIPRTVSELLSVYESCGLGDGFKCYSTKSKSPDIFYIILEKNA